MERITEAPDSLTRGIGQTPAPSSIQASNGKKVALQVQARPARLPLSYAQQRLWFINKLRAATSEYNLPFALRLTGELDLSALSLALNTIVQRHDSLRTRFDEIDGEPIQIIQDEVR